MIPRAQDAGATIDSRVRLEVSDGGKVPFAEYVLQKVGGTGDQIISLLRFV